MTQTKLFKQPETSSKQLSIRLQDIIKIDLDSKDLMSALQSLMEINVNGKYPNPRISSCVLDLLLTSQKEEVVLFTKIYKDFLKEHGSVILCKSFESERPFQQYLQSVWECIAANSVKHNLSYDEYGSMELLSEYLLSVFQNDLKKFQEETNDPMPLSTSVFGPLPALNLTNQISAIIKMMKVLLSNDSSIAHAGGWIDFVNLLK